jgi:hypothetical protein
LSVSRFDVVVVVRPELTEVHEMIHVRFPGSDATGFERRIPLERAESLSFESAAIDGTPLTPGQGGDTRLVVEEQRALTARWTFPPASNATRVFQIAYRVNGGVAVRGARGTVWQNAIPSDRPYDVDAASVRLAVDSRMHMFDGAGIAEAGWTVTRTPDGISATRAGLAAGEGATIIAEVGIEPGSMPEPAWQRYEEWSRDLIPAFVAGGLFILVIGAGVLWIIRFQYPRPKVASSSPTEEREREAVRAGLRTSGHVAVVLSAVLALVTWLTLSHFGWWPMSVPISILVVGVVFVAASKRVV